MSATMIGTTDDLDDLFRETILEHYRRPRNRGSAIGAPDIAAEGAHTSCGDRVALRLRVDDAGVITAIEWEGQGCAISQASISMMTRLVTGKNLAEAEQAIAAFRALLRGEPVPAEIDLGELRALEGVRRFPARMHCALLGWQTLADGIRSYRDTSGCVDKTRILGTGGTDAP
jgi:nitrogen fixation NifU-like protein